MGAAQARPDAGCSIAVCMTPHLLHTARNSESDGNSNKKSNKNKHVVEQALRTCRERVQ